MRTIRSVFGLAKPFEPIIPALFIIGGILGLVAASERRVDFFETYLVLSYVVFGVALILGAAVLGPWIGKVRKAAKSSQDDAPSDQLQRLLDDKKAKYAFWLLYLAIVVVVYIMVIKPYSYGKGLYL